MPGALVISLDFELYWGVPELFTLGRYQEHIQGVQKVVPSLLRLFEAREIAVTWATVGAIGITNHQDLAAYAEKIPSGAHSDVLRYTLLNRSADRNDARFFAPALIAEILKTKRQEYATHSVFHTHALSSGQAAFAADIACLPSLNKKLGLPQPVSIVLPRNQYDTKTLQTCRNIGLRCFRPTPSQWYSRPAKRETLARRGARLVDSYFDVFDDLTRTVETTEQMVGVPGSAFFRASAPLHRRMRARLETALHLAAKRHEIFHLWWHPHNFGANPADCLNALEGVLDVFDTCRVRHGMRSASMGDFVASGGATP